MLDDDGHGGGSSDDTLADLGTDVPPAERGEQLAARR